jgi:hypothetical protein
VAEELARISIETSLQGKARAMFIGSYMYLYMFIPVYMYVCIHVCMQGDVNRFLHDVYVQIHHVQMYLYICIFV